MTETRLGRLRKTAYAVHAGQVDKQGVPYWKHLEAVAEAVPARMKPVALFHDAIEDDRMTREELRGYLDPVEFNAVLLLTRDPAMTYAQYVERVATWPGLVGNLARCVKRADLEHNLGRLTPELERLRKRYEAALKRLGAPDPLPCP